MALGRLRILVSCELRPDHRVALVEALGEHEVTFCQRTQPSRFRAALETADVVIDWQLSREEIAQAERLGLIQVWGAGVDRIACDAAERQGIEIRTTAGSMARAVAEYVLLHVLLWERRLPEWGERGTRGAWNWIDRQESVFGELSERTLCIVGLGHIESEVARVVRGLDMKLIALRRRAYPEMTELQQLSWPQLPEALSHADYVSLHLPLCQQTRGLVDERFLELMSAHAVLINTSRGELVCEQALAAALRAGAIRGASLDVTKDEPLPTGSILRSLPNLIITPHHSGRTSRAVRSAVAMARRHVSSFVFSRMRERSRS